MPSYIDNRYSKDKLLTLLRSPRQLRISIEPISHPLSLEPVGMHETPAGQDLLLDDAFYDAFESLDSKVFETFLSSIRRFKLRYDQELKKRAE